MSEKWTNKPRPLSNASRKGANAPHIGVHDVEVEEEPPPPRQTVVEVRPGFVFVQGRWDRRGGQWVWMDGHWERERVGHMWVDGRWERRGRRHVWVEGSWRARSSGPANGPVIRDHRDRGGPPPPPPNNGGGPVIRDHR